MALTPEQIEEIRREYEKIKREVEDTIEGLEQELDVFDSIFNKSKQLNIQQQILNQKKRLQIEQENLISAGLGEQFGLQEKIVKETKEQLKTDTMIVSEQAKILEKTRQISASLNKTVGLQSQFFNFLMKSDKALKDITAEFGLTGGRAVMFRENIEGAASAAARLGLRIDDLTTLQRVFGDEVGSTKALTESMINDVGDIAKATNLGVEAAASLAGKFELLGVNANATADYVTQTVDLTNQLGVSATKTLRNVERNFSRLQLFYFKDGVAGITEMAAQSERLKADINETLNSMQKARTLEGSINMAANLQVLGGGFAELDPFEILFASRNDPQRFQKMISEMTNGIAMMQETANGFQFTISALDADRLRIAAETLGISEEDLRARTLKQAALNKATQEMFNLNVSPEDKEMISNMAYLNEKTGAMMIKLPSGQIKTLKDLTTGDVKGLRVSDANLKEMAKQRQTFEERFSNTIYEFQLAFLPILKGITRVIDTVAPIVEKGTAFVDKALGGNMLAGLGAFYGGALLLSAIVPKLIGALNPFKGLVNILPSLMKGRIGGGRSAARSVGGSRRGGKMRGFAKVGGIGGFGVGAAGLGVGGGIGLAATGISQLAEAVENIDVNKIRALNGTMAILGGTITAMVAVGAIAGMNPLLALGMAAVGAAAVGMGYGINLAAKGVAVMADSLERVEPEKINALGTSLLKLGGATALFAVGGLGGFLALAGVTTVIARNAEKINKVGEAMYNIKEAASADISNFREIQKTIQSIASTEVKGNSVISKMTELLNKPLKVEFSDKEVALVANINLDVDGAKFMKSLNVSSRVVSDTIDIRGGKGSTRAV